MFFLFPLFSNTLLLAPERIFLPLCTFSNIRFSKSIFEFLIKPFLVASFRIFIRICTDISSCSFSIHLNCNNFIRHTLVNIAKLVKQYSISTSTKPKDNKLRRSSKCLGKGLKHVARKSFKC